MNRTTRVRLARPLLAGLAAWCLAVPAPAAQTPLEQAQDQLKKMRTHLNAASNRFTGGMQVARPADEKGPPMTPAMQCCSANLRVVRDRLVGFDRAMANLLDCYRQREDEEGLAGMDLIRADLESLRRGLESFVKAPERGEANEALAGTTRAFLQLDKSFKKLPACEPEPQTSDPSDP